LRNSGGTAVTELFAARPDIVTQPPTDMTQVGARAADRASVRQAVDRLDYGTLTVLCAMSSPSATTGQGAHLSTGAVRMVVDAPPASVDSAVDKLYGLALVGGTPTGYHVVREAHEALRGDRADPTSHELPVCGPPPMRTVEVN